MYYFAVLVIAGQDTKNKFCKPLHKLLSEIYVLCVYLNCVQSVFLDDLT